MIAPGPGTLLIAEPFLKDPNFMRTVVFLCDHQEEGSFGFVINKTFNHTLDELMNDLEELKLPVYYGGPVQMDTIHFLHQYPELIPGSFQVMDGIYWGGDFRNSYFTYQRRFTRSQQRSVSSSSYSGWGNGQLNDELKEKSWLTAQATRKTCIP